MKRVQHSWLIYEAWSKNGIIWSGLCALDGGDRASPASEVYFHAGSDSLSEWNGSIDVR